MGRITLNIIIIYMELINNIDRYIQLYLELELEENINNFSSEKKELDNQRLLSKQNRSELVELTKKFKNLSSQEKVEKSNFIIKSYQIEINNLVTRSNT